MKKKLTILFTALSFFMIFDSMNIGQALVMLFLAGIVPGTNIVIDAGRMLEFFALLIGFTLSRITLYLVHVGSALASEPFSYQSS